MVNLLLRFQTLGMIIKICMHFRLQNNLKMFVILMNFLKI